MEFFDVLESREGGNLPKNLTRFPDVASGSVLH